MKALANPWRFVMPTLAWIPTLLLLLAGVQSSGIAQTVQGRLVEVGSGAPLEGALILLLDQQGKEQAGYLSNSQGRFLLQAPGPGNYTVRVERIGFSTITSDTIRLTEGQVFPLRLEIDFSPVRLEEIRVEGSRQCVVRPDEGMALAAIWEEARKALAVQDWTSRTQTFPFQVLRYERQLDAAGEKVEAETRQLRTVVAPTAIRSRPADVLMSEGFVQQMAGEARRFEYYGPDAAVLLSDEFLDTHCFRLANNEDRLGFIGVSFEPVREAGIPDIEGTLWLDRETAQLQSLDFQYAWAPVVEAKGLAGGHLEFESLPSGAWFIRKWWIRIPNLEVDWGARLGQRTRVLGFTEEGEEISRITSSRDEAASRYMGVVEGVVWDSTTHSPLSGAQVYLSGTPHLAVTDSSGRFAIDDVRGGVFVAAFTHPKLDSVGVYPPGVDVEVEAGGVSEAVLFLPPVPSLLKELCSGSGLDVGMSAVVGAVLDSDTGDPVPGVTVGLSWAEHRHAGGLEVLVDHRTLEVPTDVRGRYRACGVPVRALVSVTASTPERIGRRSEFEVPSNAIARVDLDLRPEDPAFSEPTSFVCPQSDEEHRGQGAVAGRIVDSSTGVPVGQLEVWISSRRTGDSQSVEADPGGRFVFCPLAPGSYTLRTVLRGFGEGTSHVIVTEHEIETQDIAFVLQDPDRRTGALRGKVIAEGDRAPISGATVALNGGEQVRVSGADGEFSFTQVPAGAVELNVSALGLRVAEGGVVLGGGQTLEIEVLMSPEPIQMDPIIVEATRMEINTMLAEVRRRAERGLGTVLMEEELASRRSITRTTDLLQEYGATVLGSTEDQRALYLRRTMCAPTVYIDGVKVFSGSGRRGIYGGGGEVGAAQAVNLVHPLNVQALEIYRGPAETPGEFLDSNAQCGVVLIWTKRGRDSTHNSGRAARSLRSRPFGSRPSAGPAAREALPSVSPGPSTAHPGNHLRYV